jgi:hypothetical protein
VKSSKPSVTVGTPTIALKKNLSVRLPGNSRIAMNTLRGSPTAVARMVA